MFGIAKVVELGIVKRGVNRQRLIEAAAGIVERIDGHLMKRMRKINEANREFL
jgi:hypothetical protein